MRREGKELGSESVSWSQRRCPRTEVGVLGVRWAHSMRVRTCICSGSTPSSGKSRRERAPQPAVDARKEKAPRPDLAHFFEVRTPVRHERRVLGIVRTPVRHARRSSRGVRPHSSKPNSALKVPARFRQSFPRPCAVSRTFASSTTGRVPRK